VTAGELAERLEVSPRTVYRDAEALSSAGVPIYTERGRAGGIRLLPGYRTDVTGLTHDEARALFVLTTGGAHEDLGLGTAARSAILKVMRAVPEPFRTAATATSQRILVDPAGWMRAPDPAGQLGVLQAAVFSDRRLRLRYRSSGYGEPEASRKEAERPASERVVDPYGLVCKAGVWYLVADSNGEPRLFRVSRVASAVGTRRRRGAGRAWSSRSCGSRCGGRSRTGLLRCRWWSGCGGTGWTCSAGSAANLDGPVVPAADADGDWATVRLRFAAVPAARTLLSFGGNVEVVSPPEVRADLASTAAEVVAQYSNVRLGSG
jgi:predicted DNA-binding transcriptional regulator YafY